MSSTTQRTKKTAPSASASATEPNTKTISTPEDFFTFRPIVFVDTVKNAASDYACDAVDALEAALMSYTTSNEEKKDVVRGADRLLAKLRAALDESLDLWELYLTRNIFKIPEEVIITSKPGTAGANTGELTGVLTSTTVPTSDEAEKALDDDLNKLRAKIVKAQSERAALQKQFQQAMEEAEAVQRIVQDFEVLNREVYDFGRLATDAQKLVNAATSLEHVMERARRELQEIGLDVGRAALSATPPAAATTTTAAEAEVKSTDDLLALNEALSS